jgi:hypothetical protein
MPTPILPTIVPVGLPQKIRRPSLEGTSFLFFYHVKLLRLTWVLWEAEHAMGESPSARPRNNFSSRILSAIKEGLVKPVHFVCVGLILAGTIGLAQFGPNRLANRASGMPFAQEPQPGLPPNLFRLPQAMPFAQRQRGRSRRRRAKWQCDEFGFVNRSGNENGSWWDGPGPLGFGAGLSNDHARSGREEEEKQRSREELS